MIGRHRQLDDPTDELRLDRRAERRLLWKGFAVLLVVVALVVVRHFYFR